MNIYDALTYVAVLSVCIFSIWLRRFWWVRFAAVSILFLVCMFSCTAVISAGRISSEIAIKEDRYNDSFKEGMLDTARIYRPALPIWMAAVVAISNLAIFPIMKERKVRKTAEQDAAVNP